jgi:hypothetical protein
VGHGWQPQVMPTPDYKISSSKNWIFLAVAVLIAIGVAIAIATSL